MGVPEVKQDHAWCPHVNLPGGGCKIYKDRPERCRDFHCQYLIDTRFGEHWFPARAKIVVDVKLGPPKTVCFIVDPGYPNRWREQPWHDDIKHMAQAGIEGRLGEKWRTLVLIKDEKIPIIGSARLLHAAG